MKGRRTMLQPKRGRKLGPQSSSTGTNYSSSSSSLSLDDPPKKHINYSSSPKITRPRDSGVAFTNEPTHNPSDKDVSRTIRIYSHLEKDLIEVEATFVDDLDQNWISKGLLDRLKPEFSLDEPRYGRIALKSVMFLGTTKIQWVGRDSLKTIETDCRVVRAECFDLYLRKCLLPPSIGQRTSRNPSDSVPAPLPIPPEDSSPPLSSPPLVVGSFDGLTLDGQLKWIDDDTDKSIRADNWMMELKSTLHTYIGKPSEGPRPLPAVKIAVLDTGIDSKHPFINGAVKTRRINAAKSFVDTNSSTEDTFGHGTHVAKLLLDVAPEAELYVAKVAEEGTLPPDHNISKAIRWAIGLNVDIITMSFGLKNGLKEIEDAVQEAAYSKSILIFAAASNEGGNSPVTYPARYEGVFCIFSTDGLGNDSKCNPTPMKDSTYHFATLGEAVKSAWPIHLVEREALERKIPGMWIATPEAEPTQPVANQDPYRRMTGTSFATPIAAGIAACLLEFSIINKMDDEQYQVLRSRKGMRAVFSEKLGEERKGFHYIHPWKLFDRIRDEKTILTLMTDVLKNV